MRGFTLPIRGVQYRVVFHRRMPPGERRHGGYCTSPKSKRPTIGIDANLPPERMLSVLIHEILHACWWDADEEAIVETEEALVAAITALRK